MWYTDRMTTQVPVRLTNSDLAALDAAIARGRFANRSEALRAGLDRILYEERQDEIDERYAAGYGKHPQEEWIGELGLAGLAAFDGAEGGPPL
jgi:Arc/MetJ-type ribon-helix-helix transcriptional regulator